MMHDKIRSVPTPFDPFLLLDQASASYSSSFLVQFITATYVRSERSGIESGLIFN